MPWPTSRAAAPATLVTRTGPGGLGRPGPCRAGQLVQGID